jgi:hypothetical protein
MTATPSSVSISPSDIIPRFRCATEFRPRLPVFAVIGNKGAPSRGERHIETKLSFSRTREPRSLKVKNTHVDWRPLF